MLRGEGGEALRGLIAAAQRAIARRFARATVRQDKSYWKFWVAYCELIGTPPLRVNTAANTGAIPHLYEREVAIALGAFMTFIADNPGFKAESMLARMRGVARRHTALGLSFVSLSLVVTAAAGVVQEHIDDNGHEALMPKSKEPFQTEEIVAMLQLPYGTRVGHITVGDNLDWQGVVVFICAECTGGWRKEGFAIGPDERMGPRKISLWHVTYRIGGALIRAPALAQLAAITIGDACYICNPPCKNDADGSKYGASPVPSRYHPTRPINLCRELAKYEIMRAVPAERRRQEAIALGPGGAIWKKRALDDFFKLLVRAVGWISEHRATQLSIHSFRVWLACALLSNGCTPEQIMLMLRWSSDAARRLYARLQERVQAAAIDAAAEASIESVRAHTLLSMATVTAAPTPAETAALAVGQRVEQQARALEAASEARTVATAEALAAVCVIDDDHVHARVHGELSTLRTRAERLDAETGADAGESDSDADADGDAR